MHGQKLFGNPTSLYCSLVIFCQQSWNHCDSNGSRNSDKLCPKYLLRFFFSVCPVVSWSPLFVAFEIHLSNFGSQLLSTAIFRNQFSSVQSLSCVRLCNPWTAAHQASLSITISRSLLKLMSIELVMPSNHLILCCPLFLLPSIFPSIRVFSNESALHIRWPKYQRFNFNISPSNEHPGLMSSESLRLI